MSDKSLSQEKINNLILLYKKGLIKEALVEAEQLIENNPNSFFLHNIHGMININLKKWNKSIESFSKAIEIKQDYAEAHNNLGVALNNLARDEMQEYIALNKRDKHGQVIYNLEDFEVDKSEFYKSFDKIDIVITSIRNMDDGMRKNLKEMFPIDFLEDEVVEIPLAKVVSGKTRGRNIVWYLDKIEKLTLKLIERRLVSLE